MAPLSTDYHPPRVNLWVTYGLNAPELSRSAGGLPPSHVVEVWVLLEWVVVVGVMDANATLGAD